MIRHAGEIIYGTHESILHVGPEWHAARTKFFGPNGVSEIAGGRGRRELVCKIWLHNEWTLAQHVADAIAGLDSRVGQFGRLETVAEGAKYFNSSYENCVFEGFAKEAPGILRDIAGTLDGGWFCMGSLRFTQLAHG